MKIINQRSNRDPNTGKNTVLVELDEDDVILFDEILRKYEQDGKYDKDDSTLITRLNHDREMVHKAFTIVRPS